MSPQIECCLPPSNQCLALPLVVYKHKVRTAHKAGSHIEIGIVKAISQKVGFFVYV